MAQLNDTMVQGSLRVTGKIYGTGNAIRVEDANLAIPPLGVGDYVGSTGDFFISAESGKNLPNTVDNFDIHTTVTHYSSTTYRLSQIATPTSSSNPAGIYERGAISSDGVTWTFGSWLAAASSSHTHTTSIASDGSSGTVVTLAHNTQYKLTAGGNSVLFKTPADSNTDTKVTQTADNSSTGTGFEVLFSATGDNTTRTEGSRKSNKLTFQPSTGTLTATKFSGPLTGNVTGNCSGSSGSCTGNAATATTATNANITRTADTTNGDKLQIGTGTAVNITNAKHAASADSATNYTSSGGIATALAGKASTGHAHDDRYIRASSGNKTLSFGGTTTLGTVQGNNVNLVMPEANADTYEVYAGSTSFEDALAAFNANKKLLLRVGKPGSGSYTTSYYLPLYRVQFNGNTITQFVWMLDSDAYGDADGSNTYGAIYIYKLSESGWSNSSDNVEYAKTAGTAYGGVADYLKYSNNNEINFKNVPTSGNKFNHWFNYRNGDNGGLDASNPLTDYYFGDRNKGTNTTLHAARLAGSADSVNATTGNSITSTGTNGSMEILNGALNSAGGGGGSCSIDGDGISFTQGVSGSSMTAGSIATSGTGTFAEGASAKGRPIDGSASIISNRPSVYWNPGTTHLVISRSAGSTTIVDLKDLTNKLVYWLHVPCDNIIALKNSSTISTFYCYDSAFTMNKTTDTYNIRSHIQDGSHGGFSTAIVRSDNIFYVMMDY